jgi:hypothetical protein
MGRQLRWVVAAALAASIGNGVAQAAECDRACLTATLDRYLGAIVKHDPSAAPLAIGFRQTENAVNVRLGNGAWKTVTGLGKLQRRYFDAVSGQAAYFGIVEEGSASAIVTVRIRVEDRAITEAEWYLARAGDPGLNGPAQPGRGSANLFNPESLIANPPPQRTVPRAQRLPREALERIVNSYFDGITSHDGSVIIAHPGCTRIENGTGMTGPGRGGAGARGGGPAPAAPAPATANDCTSGLATINIQMVVARRYPVIDEEAGAVLATAVFIRRPGSPAPRNVFSEWFFIDEGKIRTIYSAMFYPPPDLAVPNWPPYDGNWPLPATTVPSAATAGAAAQAARCDRNCLTGTMTRYLNAVVAHDTQSLPLAPNVRFTEDGRELRVGEGLWKTASKLRPYRVDFIDTAQGVAAVHTVVEEGGTPVLFTARLKVVDGRIAEIETLAVRSAAEGALFAPDNLREPSAAMTYAPRPDERMSRDAMVALASRYPAGLRAGSFVTADVPFAPSAYRIENGVRMAGPGCTFQPPGCEQMRTQRIPTLPDVTQRLVAVDEEMGRVLFRLDFGRGSLPGAAYDGKSLVTFEAFKVYGGMVHAAEAIFEAAPLGASSGWD